MKLSAPDAAGVGSCLRARRMLIVRFVPRSAGEYLFQAIPLHTFEARAVTLASRQENCGDWKGGLGVDQRV
jgi:hypothetical protein